LLTGTPVQNDLQEFYTLSNFVNPGIFGNYSDYKSYYEQLIVTSHYSTGEGGKVLLGQERAKELHERSKTFILRRTNNLINQYLPQKHEVVIFCRPTDEQSNLYSLITDYWFNRSIIGGGITPLTIITALKKVCNHPHLFTSEQNNSLHEVLSLLPTNLLKVNTSFSFSSKVKVVQAIFQALKETQEKLVLVSYYTQTLDFLEKLCCAERLQFCRLDGTTVTTLRTKIVEKFNSKDNHYCRKFYLC
jgi:DNA repair and recombination protein RAD54B